MKPRLHYDDVAWEKSESITDDWVRLFLKPDVREAVGTFLTRHHSPGDALEFRILERGGFNISLRMKYKDANDAIIRFPQPGGAMFPEEKVRIEVATMRYIQNQTSIPIPFVHHWGTREESPMELGPFIIMDYINHDTSMYHALNKPGCPRAERGTLDPNISLPKLKTLYGEAARLLLQLFQPSLHWIGSINQTGDFTWEARHRPLSMPMNTLVQLGSLPQSKLPTTTFETTSAYLQSLAQLHIIHLTNQRNDAIDSADDCRRKLVARYLFRKLAREHRLTKRWRSFDNGPFKLWCDDLRPANILINEELEVVGVVDWEFTYAAPVEFSFAPPWWLLIEKPEYWPQGFDDWCSEYDKRLETFLGEMKFQEEKGIKQGWLKSTQRLSNHMKDSWESGDFWIAYAARNNFAFDFIYWRKIDQRFFGPTASPVEDIWKQRLGLLEPKERVDIERFVEKKLVEMKTRVLAWDPDDYTKELAEKSSGDNAAERDQQSG